MFFYNEKQEFIGIDDDSLRVLGYNSFDEFLNDCSDVAELFEKEPGHIHKFQNLSWINFLLHADIDNRLAIVNAKNRKFVCTLEPHALYLSSSPQKSGHIIKFVNIKNISGEASTASTASQAHFVPKTPNVTEHILPTYDDIKPTSLKEPGLLDVPLDSSHLLEISDNADIESTLSTFSQPKEQQIFDNVDEFEDKIKLDLDGDFFKSEPSTPKVVTEVPIITKDEPKIPAQEPKLATITSVKTQTSVAESIFTPDEFEYIKELEVAKDYKFDPNVAANELGLPVDLIEEFIGDFIYQAHEFKDELFESIDNADINNLRILSHKLKGVAANLRIEDAFESLAIINTSDNHTQIQANLKYLYIIIDKLEGKEIPDLFSSPEPEPFEFKEEPSFADLVDDSTNDEIYDFAPLDIEDSAHVDFKSEEPIDSTLDIDFQSNSNPQELSLDELLPKNDTELENYESQSKIFEDNNDEIYDFGPLILEDEAPHSDEIDTLSINGDSFKNEDLYTFEEKGTDKESHIEFNDDDNDGEIYDFLPLESDIIDSTDEVLSQPQIDTPSINKDQISGELGIDIDFLEELISDYKNELSKASINITASIGSFDTQGWKKAAANLVGISDNLRLSELSETLKTIAQTNDAQEAKRASQQLHTLLEQL